MKQDRQVEIPEKTIEEFINEFRNSMIEHTRPMISDLTVGGLFRARKVNNIGIDDLKKTKCIWYPDWSTIEPDYYTYNRCSDKGENFFYASNSLEATVREMHLKDGDRLLIGIFHTDNSNIQIPSQFVGIETLKKTPEFKRLLGNYIFKTESDREKENNMVSYFTHKIVEGEEALYKPCIALSRILLKNEMIKCLVYPSVASDYRLVNFGIKSDFVDDYMNCQEAYIYKVLISNSSIKLIPEKFAGVEVDRTQHPKDWSFKWKPNSEKEKQEGMKEYSV